MNRIIILIFAAFEEIYERLGVKNLIPRGESFYQDMMVSTVETLESNGEQNIQVKWLDRRTCNHKVVGSNPTKLTTDFTMTRISYVV